MDAFPKVVLILLLFISRNKAFNFDGDLNMLKNTVHVLNKEMNSLKEAARVLSKRMDGLQQILENVLHNNGITSYTPQSTDEIQNPTEALKEENGNAKRSFSSYPDTKSSIAFFAEMSYSEPNIGKHHLLLFDNALLNTGNGYHSTLGVFIAPQTGVYVFMWTVRITELSIVLFVNGAIYTSTFNRPYEHDVSGNLNADESVTGFTIVHVNQGDDVQLRTHSTYVGKLGLFSNGFGK